MGSSIEIRFYPKKSRYDEAELFTSIVASIDSFLSKTKWVNLRVCESDIADIITDASGPSTASAVREFAGRIRAKEPLLYAADTLWPLWKCEDAVLIREYFGLTVESWDRSFYTQQERTYPGSGRIWSDRSYPFRWSSSSNPKSPQDVLYQQRIKENVEEFLQLFRMLANKIDIGSLKVFLPDSSFRLPINSHCTYFAEPKFVIEDLDWMVREWELPVPGFPMPIPPLKHFDAKLHESTLSELRTAEQRESLWRQ